MSILKDRKWQIVIGVVLLVLIAIVLILVLPKKDDNTKDNEDKPISEKDIITEDDLKKTYDMSKEDAIKIIKKEYNDDNYDFSAIVNEQGLYVITVKNRLTDTVDKYNVDPSNGAYYVIIDDIIEK